MAACARASSSHISVVNSGASKLNKFLNRCYSETNSKKWCEEVARPNPESSSAFDCTNSIQQAHVSVHPDESTWKYAIGAVKVVRELVAQGVKVSTIYI